MNKSLPVFFLYAVILLEGYIVLSSELLAIRQTMPLLGSGTDTISIIIAAVLVPLAFGYYTGGKYRPGFNKNSRYTNIRNKLADNIFIAMCILLVGLSYPILNDIINIIDVIGLHNRLVIMTLYSAFFLVIPVYLLGQTIPLISNYFPKEKTAKITGKILFFSTIGSCLGAVFSTLVLMTTIGVNYTAALNVGIMGTLVILLSKKKRSKTSLFTGILVLLGIVVNSDSTMRIFNIIENNQYNNIAVVNKNSDRALMINNRLSSVLTNDGRKNDYIEYIERLAIAPTHRNNNPINILVIGAGGFTIGFEDTLNNYDFVDIDKSLKEISEEYILQKPLGKNKTFHPVPARAFLRKPGKNYDVIVLDAFLNDVTTPEHLVTLEFFKQIKSRLNYNGVMAGNFFAPASLNNSFSLNLDHTIRSVFPSAKRHALYTKEQNLWAPSSNHSTNIVYTYKHLPELQAPVIYTDNRNLMFLDKLKNYRN